MCLTFKIEQQRKPITHTPTVEDKSITNDRSNNTKNDRRKARLKNRTTEARGDLKRNVLINKVTQDTRVKGTQSLVREEASCQIVIGELVENSQFSAWSNALFLGLYISSLVSNYILINSFCTIHSVNENFSFSLLTVILHQHEERERERQLKYNKKT